MSSSYAPLTSEPRLVASRFVGRLPLESGVVLVTHVLGRARYACDEGVMALLDAFARPRREADVVGDSETLRAVVRELRAADLLLPTNAKEEERLRDFFARRFEIAPAARAITAARGGSNARLVFSSALAVLDLGQARVVTHPLARRVHLAHDLWRIAAAFKGGARTNDVAKRLRLSRARVSLAVDFLGRRGVLWPSLEAEQNAGALVVGTRAIHRFDSGCGEWEQIFLPHSPETLAPITRRARITAIGACQVHASTPALLWLAERAGIALDVDSYQTAAMAKIAADTDVVLLSMATATVGVYEALATDEDGREATLAMCAHVDDALAAIRAQTDAPILLHDIGRPGLAADPSRRVLAAANAALASRAADWPRTYMLDQDAAVMTHGHGVHWDDEYNALRHHAAVSMWGRPPRDLGETPKKQALPEIGPGQGDPVVPLAMAHLAAIERALVTTPIQLIVFEPNGLLWPGRLEDREGPYPRRFNFYTGDSVSKYLGVHEALVTLQRRGMMLACVSTCPKALLEERWRYGSHLPTLVTLSHLRFIGESVDDVTRALGIAPEATLVLNGDGWELRRLLLTAPALHPLRAQIERTASRAVVREAPRRVADPARHVRAALMTALRCDEATLLAARDLRSLGLDSLASVSVLAHIEEELGIELPDAERTGGVLFSLPALTRAVERALSATSGEVEAAHEVGAEDIPTRLAANIRDPKHSWILKIVRSSARMDYEHVSWAQLAERASGYAALYRDAGVAPGELVTILLPTGASLVAAVVGAFLARILPSVCAFPSEKLSTEAFGAWFGTLARESGTRLVICDPALADAVRRLVDVPVHAEEPRPCAFSADLGPATPDAPALVQYSSGTTGIKKAVVLTHRAVLTHIARLHEALACRDEDVIVSWLPLYHDMGYVACLLLPLLAGLRTVHLSPFDWVANPALLLQQVSEERGTLAWMPNFALLHTAQRVSDGALAGLDLSSLRAVVNCSEPVTAEAMDRFHARLAMRGLRCNALSASYAMAETTFAVTQGIPARRLRVARSALAQGRLVPAEQDAIEIVSSGRAIHGVRVHIESKDGTTVPDGVIGEVCVESESLMTGYFRAAPQEGAYRTGDLGALWDGELYVTGRAKDLVIVAGENVYPHEIEEALGTISGLKPGRIVVFGVFDEKAGTERLVAMAETLSPDHDALREAMRRITLDRIRVTLSDVVLVPERTLQKSTSGKLSRARNRDLYLARAARPEDRS